MKNVNAFDFFCSPIGLGHVTRDIAIANNLHNSKTNFITGSSAAQILKNQGFSVQDVYRPPPFVVNKGVLEKSASWLWRYYRYYRNCKKISKALISRDIPSMVLSDEDFASLTVAQEKEIPTVLITDILETQFTKGWASFIERKMNKSMRKIIEKCDVVIIPENGKDEDNIKRVGPIIRETHFSRSELRGKFSFFKKTIVISIGGTAAGKFLIEKSLQAITKINEDIDVVLASGPSVKERYEHVRNIGFVDNLHEWIFAADLLISLAGKSTIDEANAYGTPAIFIPIKDHFEQEDNAREQGFSFEDIDRLDKIISYKLEEARNQRNSEGAKKAADIVENLANGQSKINR